jgi:hypothetical protein
MCAGTRGYHAEPKFPDILTDDELRAIRSSGDIYVTYLRDGPVDIDVTDYALERSAARIRAPTPARRISMRRLAR